MANYDFYIGLLAVLTTVLIGYQVFQSINITSITKSLKKEQKRYRTEMAKSTTIMYRELAVMQLLNQPKYYIYYYTVNMLKAIKAAERIADVSFLEELNESMSGKRTASMGFTEEQKEEISQLKATINKRKFKRYSAISTLLH